MNICFVAALFYFIYLLQTSSDVGCIHRALYPTETGIGHFFSFCALSVLFPFIPFIDLLIFSLFLLLSVYGLITTVLVWFTYSRVYCFTDLSIDVESSVVRLYFACVIFYLQVIDPIHCYFIKCFSMILLHFMTCCLNVSRWLA